MRIQRWKMVSMLSVILFVVAIGSVVAYYYYQQKNKPVVIFREAVEKLASEKGDQLYRGGGTVGFTVNVAGEQYVLEAEMRLADTGVAYLKPHNIKGVVDVIRKQPELAGYASSFETAATALDGRWIRVAEKDLQVVASMSDSQRACVQSLQDIDFSADDKKALESFVHERVVAVGERAASKSGETEIQYVLNFSSLQRGEFSSNISRSPSLAAVIASCKVSSSELENMWQNLRVTLWAGEKSRRFHKILIQNGTQQSKEYIMFDFNFGQTDAPEDFTSLDEVNKQIRTLFPNFE